LGQSSIAALLMFLPLAAFGEPDASTIIQRSVEANERDWEAAPAYGYTERVRSSSGVKTYDVEMIEGSPYRRLIAVNGRPLPPEERTQQQQSLKETIAERRRETPQARAERIAEYERGRKRDHLLMEQLTDALQFTLEGQRQLGSYRCYVLQATPRPGYQPPDTQAQVLTRMRGKLWIDAKSYQWVKVQATVIGAVSIDGFLARVEPGTRFELDKEPAGDGVWLPRHFSMSVRSMILFVFAYHKQADDWYSNYHKIA
jgi:uncharacterized membrane protein